MIGWKNLENKTGMELYGMLEDLSAEAAIEGIQNDAYRGRIPKADLIKVK